MTAQERKTTRKPPQRATSPRLPSEADLAERRQLGNTLRGSEEARKHEEAIRSIRTAINVLIADEKKHKARLEELKKEGLA